MMAVDLRQWFSWSKRRTVEGADQLREAHSAQKISDRKDNTFGTGSFGTDTSHRLFDCSKASGDPALSAFQILYHKGLLYQKGGRRMCNMLQLSTLRNGAVTEQQTDER